MRILAIIDKGDKFKAGNKILTCNRLRTLRDGMLGEFTW